MADRRPDTDENSSKPSKRQKTSASDMDPKTNPYLAHMYEEDADDNSYSNGYANGYSNGYEKAPKTNGMSGGSGLSKFPRHSTTADMARKAEDGPNNPFSGKPLSTQYLNILKTRRNLPVHAQRYVNIMMYQTSQTNHADVEMNSLRCTRSPRFSSLLVRLVQGKLLRSLNLFSSTICLISTANWSLVPNPVE